jgi:hypothetical protein
MPISSQNWSMYDLPEPGEHYWHGRTGYVVDRIGMVDEVPHVHLVRDPAWEDQLSDGLPDDHMIDGGRREGDGTWHFQIVGPNGRLAGDAWSVGSELEPAIRQAVAGAIAQLNR